MKYVAAILTGLLGVLIVAAPVSAHHKSDHQGGPSNHSAVHSEGNKQNKDDESETEKKTLKSDDEQHQGLHLGQLVRSIIDNQADKDNQADELADELRDCTSTDSLRDMRRGEIKHLAHAAGLKTKDIKDLLSSDGEHQGLGRLLRDDLESNEVDALKDDLREGLEASDLKDLSVGKILQAARSCGLTTHELAELLRDD